MGGGEGGCLRVYYAWKKSLQLDGRTGTHSQNQVKRDGKVEKPITHETSNLESWGGCKCPRSGVRGQNGERN